MVEVDLGTDYYIYFTSRSPVKLSFVSDKQALLWCITLLMFIYCLRRINVGSRFQAEIPLLRDRSLAASDVAKEQLVWQPWEDLENNPAIQENGKKKNVYLNGHENKEGGDRTSKSYWTVNQVDGL